MAAAPTAFDFLSLIPAGNLLFARIAKAHLSDFALA